MDQLRGSLRQVMREMPFTILGAVVLPDHMHFLWSLPRGDDAYSKRVGRMEVLFTQGLGRSQATVADLPDSRRSHRESNVWQRRFWEHTITDEADFERHLDSIHPNPVQHGLVRCPHRWPQSSFHR